jgi:hypothetical protein
MNVAGSCSEALSKCAIGAPGGSDAGDLGLSPERRVEQGNADDPWIGAHCSESASRRLSSIRCSPSLTRSA